MDEFRPNSGIIAGLLRDTGLQVEQRLLEIFEARPFQTGFTRDTLKKLYLPIEKHRP